jgi:ComF family protein
MSVLTRPMRIGLTAGRHVLDIVLPPHCPTCDTIVDTPGQLCIGCFRRASLIVPPCCVRCGVGFASAGSAGLSLSCPACLQAPPPWRFGRAAFVYDDFSRLLVLPLKYGDRTENAAILGRHMARAGQALLDECDLLVPVPLHRRRLFSRRYNQAALLAYAVGRLCGRPVMVDALARVKQTASLVGQSAVERRRAVADAIRVRPHRVDVVRGKRVVVVDDVLTTGATAGVCTAALLAAGAATVDVLAAARTARDETREDRREDSEE